MLTLIVYLIVGAVMLYSVDKGKLETLLPDWYYEYEQDNKNYEHGYFDRETFDKIVKGVIAVWFVLLWPTVIILGIVKLLKGKK